MVLFYRILLSTCMLLPVANHATCTLPAVIAARVSTDNAGIRLRGFAEVRAQRASKNDSGVLPIAR